MAKGISQYTVVGDGTPLHCGECSVETRLSHHAPHGSVAFLPNGSVAFPPNGSVRLLPNKSVRLLPNGSVRLLPNKSVKLLPNKSVKLLPNKSVRLLPNKRGFFLTRQENNLELRCRIVRVHCQTD